MRALQPLVLKRFDDISTSYDLEVDQYCQSVQRSHQAILQKQFSLAQTFGNMMDEQLSAEEDACNPLNEALRAELMGQLPQQMQVPRLNKSRSAPHNQVVCIGPNLHSSHEYLVLYITNLSDY